MFVALRFLVACATLAGAALCPKEWRIIFKIGTSTLLLLYAVEDIVETVDMIKEMRVDKNVGSKS